MNNCFAMSIQTQRKTNVIAKQMKPTTGQPGVSSQICDINCLMRQNMRIVLGDKCQTMNSYTNDCLSVWKQKNTLHIQISLSCKRVS